MSRKYAIVDIETTGGMYLRDKITEIAIIVTDGVEILSQYQSLINPERFIPSHITRITGIDDEMVASAPKFYEVAKDIVEALEGCIFVAHNVNFDYSFIKAEFKSLGYAFNKKKLCTVRLVRSTIPGLDSYGLDHLIAHFAIQIEHRHRAYDDALATCRIFQYLISDHIDDFHLNKVINYGVDASVLPKGMSMEEVEDLPEPPGVYYLSNRQGQIVYVGKAINIRKRIFQHFRKISAKSNRLKSFVEKIHFEKTGNELIALLLELYEIKRLRPEFNRAMKRKNYPYTLYLDAKASENRPCFVIASNNKKNEIRYLGVKNFSSKGSAEYFVQQAIHELEICATNFRSTAHKFECYCGGDCDQLMINRQQIIDHFITFARNDFDQNLIILLPGRQEDEWSFVMIHEKRFWGFGYVPSGTKLVTSEEWNDYIAYQFWYPEAQFIVRNYMDKSGSWSNIVGCHNLVRWIRRN